MSGQLFQRIAHVDNAAGASATIVSPVFDPYDFLEVWIRIAGYAGGSIAILQFNGDTGTTAYSNSVMEGANAPTTQISGVASGWVVATTAITAARGLIHFRITNISGRAKSGVWAGSSASESAATAPTIVQGAGVWTTTTQINRMVLSGGGVNLNAGSSMDIYGCL